MAKKKAARLKWLNDRTKTPMIDTYARQLDTFIETMADGIVDKHELEAQEKRLVKLMKEVEPLLDDDLHAKVTQLLCELTSYDIMHLLHTLEAARPKVKFRG